ncbi:DUF447 domain-containing protein [Cupriavidus sp. IK-TO18]|uniref:DUF447 domain-containing protein n=1 Tax=Cupriavidus sp. IK-TO18 TaxID=2782182 RepID=UPI00189B193B|nr:DUF447 domain-containing protein [Cupriavidus sp. IK-TO18]MBF6989196.1 DUF447 family protein [Cupriavidus sp. IK-TO18]
MNDLIYETIVTTVSAAGRPHIAPMGVRHRGDDIVLMPFRPSTTYDNIVGTGAAVVNLTNDVRVFAGCLTGRHRWPTVAAERIRGVRLAGALSHLELRLRDEGGDPNRPTLRMARVYQRRHGDFPGFNRAQAAVIEAAVLVSRLHMLAPDKIAREMAYLQIAIDKTAGPAEHEAWQWLRERIDAHNAASLETTP